MQDRIEDDVRRFIAENFLYRDDTQGLGSGQSLLAAGLVDSTGVLELVAFLEERFSFRIPDSDMLPENLDSIAGLVAYVARRIGAAQASA
jgi:acyl carrier protein